MNCKRGDLAVIVGADYSVENIGFLVEVVRPYVSFEILNHGHSSYGYAEPGDWVVRALGSPFFILRSDGSHNAGVFHVVRDRYLLPIRPGDISDSTETMKEKEAA
jgi:hypothetical protein